MSAFSVRARGMVNEGDKKSLTLPMPKLYTYILVYGTKYDYAE